MAISKSRFSTSDYSLANLLVFWTRWIQSHPAYALVLIHKLFFATAYSKELIAGFQIKMQPPELHQKASHCCQTQTRSFDKHFFSCWCWHMLSLSPKPLFLQHLSACWYNCWCSFAVKQMRELLHKKATNQTPTKRNIILFNDTAILA